eukprot:1541141-Alexandrium_andersonii.AAC.1
MSEKCAQCADFLLPDMWSGYVPRQHRAQCDERVERCASGDRRGSGIDHLDPRLPSPFAQSAMSLAGASQLGMGGCAAV